MRSVTALLHAGGLLFWGTRRHRKTRCPPPVGQCRAAVGGGGVAYCSRLSPRCAAWGGLRQAVRSARLGRERWATARAQEAVGADCDAPLGQDVWQEAAHTLCGGERAVAPRAARALLEAAGDGPILACFQAVGGDGKPMERGGKGGEALGAGRLTMGDPALVPDLG
jgi:hypothetical protein